MYINDRLYSCRCPRWRISVKLHPYKTNDRTDGRTKRRDSVRPSVRSFVRLFVRCVCQSVRGVHPIGGTNRDLQKFRGTKFRDQPINTRNLVSRLSGKAIIKIIAIRCHILRLKCTKFYSRRLSVRSSVRPSLRGSLTLKRCASAVTDINARMSNYARPNAN